MRPRRPPISIVIPHFEAIDYLPATLESARREASGSDEIVIVDDGSAATVFERVSQLSATDSRIRLLRHDGNLGGGAARNTAVVEAQNNWIFCLDSDNLLSPGLLDKLWAGAESLGLDVAVPEFTVYFDKSPNALTHAWGYGLRPVTLIDHVMTDYVPSASGNYLYTRDSWLRVGGYPTTAGALDAWGFGLRQIAAGARMQAIRDTYYLHRYGYPSYYVRQSAKQREMRGIANSLLSECSEQLPWRIRTEIAMWKVVPTRLRPRAIPRVALHVGERFGTLVEPLSGRVASLLRADAEGGQ